MNHEANMGIVKIGASTSNVAQRGAVSEGLREETGSFDANLWPG